MAELVFDNCRVLALAVVTNGIHDAVTGVEEAREWIGSEVFELWCDRCDLHPEYLRRRVARLLASGRSVLLPDDGDDEAVDIDEAVRLHEEEGYTWSEAAAKMNVSVSTLRNRRKAAGHNMAKSTGAGATGKEIIKIDLEAARRLHERGLTWREIADQLGVSAETLRLRRKAFGGL